jgi:hypothetical protein
MSSSEYRSFVCGPEGIFPSAPDLSSAPFAAQHCEHGGGSAIHVQSPPEKGANICVRVMVSRELILTHRPVGGQQAQVGYQAMSHRWAPVDVLLSADLWSSVTASEFWQELVAQAPLRPEVPIRLSGENLSESDEEKLNSPRGDFLLSFCGVTVESVLTCEPWEKASSRQKDTKMAHGEPEGAATKPPPLDNASMPRLPISLQSFEDPASPRSWTLLAGSCLGPCPMRSPRPPQNRLAAVKLGWHSTLMLYYWRKQRSSNGPASKFDSTRKNTFA